MQECVLSTDRRSVRTRRALRRALADEILATGDLSRVTVTAVTERAGVTRRTFYSHFKDIPDLVNQIEGETLAELEAPLAHLAACHLDDLRVALDHGAPAPGAEALLTAVRDRADYLRPLLGNGGDPAFAERIKALVYEVVGARAVDGLDLRAFGPLFDYYLTFLCHLRRGRRAAALARRRLPRERAHHGAPHDGAHVRAPRRPL